MYGLDDLAIASHHCILATLALCARPNGLPVRSSRNDTVATDSCTGLKLARALNCFSPHCLPCDVPGDIDFFTWGFVCTDFSSRNMHSAANRNENMIQSGEKTSGGTWRGGMDYVRVHRPVSGLAENVRTLACTPSGDDKDESGLVACQQELSEAGYASVAILASPHEYWVPENRWRALLPFSKKLSLRELQGVARDFKDLRNRAALLPLEMFMLDPDDPLVAAELDRQLESKPDGAQTGLSNKASEKWSKRGSRGGRSFIACTP